LAGLGSTLLERWRTTTYKNACGGLPSSPPSPAPTITETPHVRFQREFKAKGFEGVFGVDFVQRNALSSFVRDTVDTFGHEVVNRIEADVDAVIPRHTWPMWSDW
jgi:hypothetical protein